MRLRAICTLTLLAALAAACGCATHGRGADAYRTKRLERVGQAAKPESAQPAVPPRLLRSGDQIVIFLNGIPEPLRVDEKVDDAGKVTLPHIGQVAVAGKTSAEVEKAIEQEYIARRIYKEIDAVVIPPESQFFVQGEVQRPGGFSFTRNLTLMQAVSTAGGFTVWANKARVKVQRRETRLYFDCGRIEDGKVDDPVIEAEDVIVVPRRWW